LAQPARRRCVARLHAPADGRRSRITLHVIEGSIAQIKKQLATSIDAFFDLQHEMK
jgi:hypothetical protein